jgi:hypothetical protein
MSPSPALNEDWSDLLRALLDHGVEFVIAGAHALAVHGVARATGDLDVLVRPSAANAARVVAALRVFGAPLEAHGLSAADLTVAGTVYQLGQPPRRIDLMTEISGVGFDEAWLSRREVTVAGMRLPFLGRDALAKNKRAAGRPKDLVDVSLLESPAD